MAVGPRRVLILCEDQGAAKVLGLVLEQDGHDVRTAHDEPAALGVAASFRPDVVLLDVDIPDGHLVAVRLRQDDPRGAAVLVAMSDYNQEADLRLSRNLRFDFHAVKPIDPVALRAVVADPRHGFPPTPDRVPVVKL